MNQQQRKLVQFVDGDLVHIISQCQLGRLTMYICQIVASREGREGGELHLTDAELKRNLSASSFS